jgi:hypothetical protein
VISPLLIQCAVQGAVHARNWKKSAAALGGRFFLLIGLKLANVGHPGCSRIAILPSMGEP